jgi:hypothetical protein
MMSQCPLCGFYTWDGVTCHLDDPGLNHKENATTRLLSIEWAYCEMQSRGWGFTSDGDGFGDPLATFTAIGPYDGVLVNVLAADKDVVKAVREAILKVEGVPA